MSHWGSSYFGKDSQTPFSSHSRYVDSRQEYYSSPYNMLAYKDRHEEVTRNLTGSEGPQDENTPVKLLVFRVVHLTDLTLASFIRRQDIEVLDVQQISHKEDAYKSFIVTVHAKDAPTLLHKTFWPGLVTCSYYLNQADANRGGAISRRYSARDSRKTQEKESLFPKLLIRNEPVSATLARRSATKSAQSLREKHRSRISSPDNRGQIKKNSTSARKDKREVSRVISSKASRKSAFKKKDRKPKKEKNNNISNFIYRIESVLDKRALPLEKKKKKPKKPLQAEDIGLENIKVKYRKQKHDEKPKEEKDEKQVLPKIETKKNAREEQNNSVTGEVEKNPRKKSKEGDSGTGTAADTKKKKSAEGKTEKSESGKSSVTNRNISTEPNNKRSPETAREKRQNESKNNDTKQDTSEKNSMKPPWKDANEKKQSEIKNKETRPPNVEKVQSPEQDINEKQQTDGKIKDMKPAISEKIKPEESKGKDSRNTNTEKLKSPEKDVVEKRENESKPKEARKTNAENIKQQEEDAHGKPHAESQNRDTSRLVSGKMSGNRSDNANDEKRQPGGKAKDTKQTNSEKIMTTEPKEMNKKEAHDNGGKDDDSIKPRELGKERALRRSRHVLPEIPTKNQAISRANSEDENTPSGPQISVTQEYHKKKHPNWVMSLSGLLILSPDEVISKLLGPDFDALLSQDVVSDDELFLGVKVLAHAARAKTNPEMLQMLVHKIWQPHVVQLIKTFTVTVERLYPDRAERYFWDLAEFLDLYVSGNTEIKYVPGLINTCLMEALALRHRSYVSEDIVKVFRVMNSRIGNSEE